VPLQAGNIPGADVVCRPLFIPNTPQLVAAITGALIPLIDPESWEQDGTLTTEDAALIAKGILNTMLNEACMVGEIKMYARDASNLPQGVLPCDGSMHLRTDYPRLYDVLPAALLVDADHFQTPDLTDRFILSSGARALNDVGGAEAVTLSINELPAHTHTAQPHRHTESGASTVVINGGVSAPATSAVVLPTTTGPATVLIDSAGGGQPHDNMPPYYVAVFGIQAW